MRRHTLFVLSLTVLFAIILGGARIIGEVQGMHQEIHERLRAVDQIAAHSSAVLGVLSAEPALQAYINSLEHDGRDPAVSGFLEDHLRRFEALTESFLLPQPDGTRLEIVSENGTLLGQNFVDGGRVRKASLESLAARVRRHMHGDRFQNRIFEGAGSTVFGMAHAKKTLWLQVARKLPQRGVALIFSIPLRPLSDVGGAAALDGVQLDQYVSADSFDQVLHRVGLDSYWNAIPGGGLPESVELPGAASLQALFRSMPMLEIRHRAEQAGIDWRLRLPWISVVLRWLRQEGVLVLVVFACFALAGMLKETTISEALAQADQKEVVQLQHEIDRIELDGAPRRLLKADMDQQLRRLKQLKSDHLALQVELAAMRPLLDREGQSRLDRALQRANRLAVSNQENQSWHKAHQARLVRWLEGATRRGALVDRLRRNVDLPK